MRNDWKYEPLGEICELLNGFAFKSSLYVNEGIRVIRIANVQKGYIEDSTPAFYPFSYEKDLSRYMLQEGDLLMSLTGNVGRVGILQKELLPAALNQRVACIRLRRTDILLKYLFHYFNSNFFEAQCISSSHGAAQLNMSTVWLAKHLVPVPPLSEQERIVALLDAEFEKIDAIKANAVSQLQAAKDLFQAALKDNLTPKEGWEDYTINDVISDLRTGLNPRVHFKLNTPDADCYYITVRELKGFSIEIDEKTDLVNKDAIVRINQRSHLQIGDVLFSATGTIGNTALIKEIPQNWNIKEGIYVMTPHKEMLDSKYFIYLLSSDYFLKSVRAKAEGTGVKSIAMKNLIKLPVSLPSLPEQERIAARLDAISEKVKALQANYDNTITLCNDLKQSLLKSIFA